MRKKRQAGQNFLLLAIYFLVVLCSSYVFAAEGTDISGSARYKIFSLKHISAEQGKRYLAEVNIGTVSQLPGSNTLLVTAQPRELTRAMAILKLVDAEEEFVIRAIFPASAAKNMPSNKQIAAEVGNISIGNFSNPPGGTGAARAIIDIHNDAVLAVAPVSRLKKIVSAIEQLRKPSKPEAQVPVPAEPNEPTIVATPVKQKASDVPTTVPATVRRYEPEPIANGDETLQLHLPEKLELIDLLDLVGEYLHLHYIYDPVKVKGDVTLKLHGKLQGAIRLKDLYPLLESVLKFKGFVMTRGKGNLVTIVPKAEILEIDPILQTERGKIEHGNVVITRVFELEHIDTASATNFLTAMKLGASVSPIVETGTLIVTDYAYRMERIDKLLEMVDKPGKPKQFRFRQLRYTMAQTLAPKVKTLAEQLGTVSISIAAAPPSVPSRAPPGETAASRKARLAREAAARARAQQAARPPEPTKPTVYLDADERTNRILMIGVAEQLTIVDGLIDALDVEQQDLRTLQLYPILHVDAEEVRKKLGELGIISGAVQATRPSTTITRPTRPGTPARTQMATTTTPTKEALAEEPQVVVIESTNSLLVNATAEQHIQIVMIINYVDKETEATTIPYVVYPLENQDPTELAEVLNKLVMETITKEEKEAKIVTQKKRTEEEIMIIPDPKTYSLIVYASKKNQTWISSLIEELDEYRPQVLLDVTLVEITKNEEFIYDLDIISQLTPGETVLKKLIASGFLTDFPRHHIVEAISTGAGEGEHTGAGGQGFFAKEHIQALLKIMEYKGYGRILARPKLLVNDNEEGTIKAEDMIYVAQKQTKYVPTTSTGTQPQYSPETTVSFESYTAGIELLIQPHISKGDQLQLNITLNRTDFDMDEGAGETEIQGEKFPKPRDTTTSNVQTVVTVPDDKTIILGGLEKINQSKGAGKIPILGDIPFIGGLFRNISNSGMQSKLYVFVKAHILRPGEELTRDSDIIKVSQKNRASFEEMETKFQQYKQWPGIKPKPMDPLRILEAD